MGIADGFRASLPVAAAKIEAGFGVELEPENRLRQALAEALRMQRQIAEVATVPEWRPQMPLWPRTATGRLGGFDLVFRSETADTWTGVVETKWSDAGIAVLDEVLWDAFKLAHAVATLEHVRDGFLVYAAPSVAWATPPRYARLFSDCVTSSAELIASHPSVWAWLYEGSASSKPSKLPPELRTALIAESSLMLAGREWLLRCARVRGTGEPWLDVDDNGMPVTQGIAITHEWPHPEPGPGMEPDSGARLEGWANPGGQGLLTEDELTRPDVPSVDADWPTISSFAMSMDGYAEFGGNRNLAVLANTVSAYYERLAELPPLDLRALRACLFFEGRRYHHFGHYPETDATPYLRELIEAIRVQARERPQTTL